MRTDDTPALRVRVDANQRASCDNPRPMEDPRRFATGENAEDVAVAAYRLAARSLAAPTAQEADACDREIAAVLASLLAPGCGARLAALFDDAPSADAYRYLWRALAAVARERA